MCGIGGYQGRFDVGLLNRMSAVLAHRGPDDAGTYIDPQASVGLAHRRLSILDLSERGHQPMADAGGSTHITYNGEIYNFLDLKRDLEKRAVGFRTSTDTEVLLALYSRYGVDMLQRLNGIFAFALWDSRERTMFLARDHLGVKPLYYAETPSGFLFASELKALITCPEVSREIDPVAVDQHLAFQWCAAPRTIIRGISKLEPGYALLVKDGRVSKKWRFYDLPFGRERFAESPEKIAADLRECLATAVDRQMISDVPVGAFLSGGVDSSRVAL